MSAQHTPGPWYVIERRQSGRTYYVALLHPNGNEIRTGGDSKTEELQKFADLLNDAYALGRVDEREAAIAKATGSAT